MYLTIYLIFYKKISKFIKEKKKSKSSYNNKKRSPNPLIILFVTELSSDSSHKSNYVWKANLALFPSTLGQKVFLR